MLGGGVWSRRIHGYGGAHLSKVVLVRHYGVYDYVWMHALPLVLA
jgi:hypothetical protein